jgi:hypothetical protein
MALPMQRLASAMKGKRRKGTAVSMFLLHQAPRSGARTTAVAPGVRALPWREYVEQLD